MTKILRLPEVMARTGLSRSSIYAAMPDKFPQNIYIGLRSVGWLESDIEKWIASKVGAKNNV